MVVTSPRVFGEKGGLWKFPLESIFSDSEKDFDKFGFMSRDPYSGLVLGFRSYLRFGMRHSRNGFEGSDA